MELDINIIFIIGFHVNNTQSENRVTTGPERTQGACTQNPSSKSQNRQYILMPAGHVN